MTGPVTGLDAAGASPARARGVAEAARAEARPTAHAAPAASGAAFARALEGEAARRTGASEPVLGAVRHRSREVGAAERFESFVLRSFVEEMLPDSDSGYFGTGTAGGIWRSMLAEQLGDELARDGGIGIGEMVEARNAKMLESDGADLANTLRAPLVDAADTLLSPGDALGGAGDL